MAIIIFGATGMVGQQLVKQAIFKGYKVKAFGRNVFTSELKEDPGLELVQGALFDEKQVRNALKNTEGIISAIGGAIDGSDLTRSLGMKNIVAQMKKTGVKRIVALGGMGILDSDDDKMIIDTDNYPKEYLAVGYEHLKAYRHLQNSGLDWTFVCPPDIREADVTGNFITVANHLPSPNQFFINSGDLALFMLNEFSKCEYIRTRVGISNT